MLPKSHRIPSGDIRLVLSKGDRFQTDILRCIVYTRPSGVFRCAVVVSSAFDKRATKRNRTRRLISESVRLMVPGLRGGVDCVIMPKKPVADTQKDVQVQLEQLFEIASLRL